MSTPEELRGYLGRLVGWSNTTAIDEAMHAVDLARAHRAQLMLCGPGDLVPLAYGLHRRAFGVEAPFIVCDPRRGNTPASVRSPANFARAADAFEAAAGGSLCIRRRRRPRDFTALVARLRSSNLVQYICLEESSLQWIVRPGPIEVPSLAGRKEDLPRIVDEYMFDAVQALAPAAGTLALNEEDRRWLIERAARSSLGDIEKAALRLVALRSSPNLAQAAARLGMAAVSLSRWAARGKLGPSVYAASAA